MLNLPLLDELFLLVLSLLLLNLEVHVDLVLLRNINVSKVQFLDIEIMSPQMTLLALEHYRVVFVIGKLVAKFDHINSACDYGAYVHRALRPWEEVSVLVSDIGVEAVLELAEDASSGIFASIVDSHDGSRDNNSSFECPLRLISKIVEQLFTGELLIIGCPYDGLIFTEIHEWVHQVLDDLVKDVANALLVNFLDVLLVFSHSELLQFFGILYDLIDSLELLVLFNVWLILVEAICHKLVDMIVISQMDSCLIEDVGLHVVWSFFWRDSNLGEPKTRDKAIFLENFVLIDLISCVERLSKRLELLNVSLSFSWTKSTQELKLVL